MSSTVVRALAAISLAGIAVVLFGAFRFDGGSEAAQPVVAAEPAGAVPAATTAAKPIPVLGEAQELVRLDGWLNSDDTTLQAITGANKATVVQFWTFGCFNCKNTLPHLQALYERYGAEGLEIVGVHAPEFDYEADPANVADALVDLNVTWPVALDTQKKNFRSWQSDGRRFWPRLYVVDSDGNIRFDHIGEGAYDALEETVSRLLDESA